MSAILDRILSDETIKFNEAIKLLRNELNKLPEIKQKEIEEDLRHALCEI